VANIENTKLDITKLEHNAIWGAKKSAINIVKKYAFRYAIPQDETLDNEKFALYWSNTWALKFVEVSLKYFEWKNLGYFVPASVLSGAAGFLNRIVKSESIRPQLFEKLETILFVTIFPSLHFNKEDQELFDENPVEYIRRNEEDVISYNLKQESIDVIAKWADYDDPASGKKILCRVVDFINGFLGTGQNPVNPAEP
jgi:hypothetical protein